MTREPARIFRTTVSVTTDEERAAADMVGGEPRYVEAEYAVDLAAVVAVHACVGLRSGEVVRLPGRTNVQLDFGETVTVRAPYAEVLAAWSAWREGADRLAWPRN